MAIGTNNSRLNRGPWFWCFEAVKWIPVLFIVTVVLWSYYAYVVQLCFYTITSTIKKIVYLILYHGLFGMFCWAYWQTIFTAIGRVPYKFKVPDAELERLAHADNEEMVKHILEQFASNLPTTNRTISGSVRYCDKCLHIKPDRSHHCSLCGECVLKMDHHCPWVNNCVCFTNYKFFILFLGYSLTYCLFVSLTSLEYFILFWKDKLEGNGRFHILFLFFVALMFAVSLVSLFVYHCYLVVHNRSTLEAFRSPVFRTGQDKNGFSLGKYNNFLEVFGDNPKTWFLPIYTSLGDGVVFPVQTQHQLSSYQSMDNTHTSLGDGYTFPQRHMDEDTEHLLYQVQPWDEE